MDAAAPAPARSHDGSLHPGVSIVLPVHNGARWLEDVLAAVLAARCPGPLEIVAIDDGSTDGSREILARHAAAGDLKLLDGARRGAAAALNAGIRAARYPLIAQIDQDVVIAHDWIERLTAALGDPSVAAAQGHYVPAPGARLWSRVMGLDLRQRYTQLGPWTDHVCTGNSIYRRSALVQVGLFDETLGYGYDNDMSYRLSGAGYRLAFCRDARATHYWREGLVPYFWQQYGFGYGRLDLVAKHRHRAGGDDVSRWTMMLHAPAMAAALVLVATGGIVGLAGGPGRLPAFAGLALVAGLAVERLVAGIRAAARFRDPDGALVPAGAPCPGCRLGGGHRGLVRPPHTGSPTGAGRQHALSGIDQPLEEPGRWALIAATADKRARRAEDGTPRRAENPFAASSCAHAHGIADVWHGPCFVVNHLGGEVVGVST